MVAREHVYAERIAKAVLDVAHSNEAQKVKNIEIEVGAFSGVENNAIARLVSELLMGSVAEGAYITTVASPARIVCGVCMYTGTPETAGRGKDALAFCPKCQKSAVTIHGGNEVSLRRIVMDFGKENKKHDTKKKPKTIKGKTRSKNPGNINKGKNKRNRTQTKKRN